MAVLMGLDLLGLCKMDVRMLLRELRPGTAIGVLAGSFGDYRRNLIKLLDSGKVSAVRVHLSNGPCERNGLCEVGEPKATDYKVLIQRAKRVEQLARRYPGVAFALSFRLEHDIKDPEVLSVYKRLIHEHAPSCYGVNNPFSGGPITGFAREAHGHGAKANIISNDGVSLSDAPKGWVSQAGEIALGWLHCMNGRGSGSHDPFVVPSKRKAAWFPDADDIQYCYARLDDMEPQPKVAGARIPKAPEIWKPIADYSVAGTDHRHKKGCLLTKINVSEWAIKTLDGARIGTARKFPGQNQGRNRYYASERSIELARRAGGQWVIFESGKHRLLINVIFRLGEMRRE